MGNTLFIDIREEMLGIYLFAVRGGGFELKDRRTYPFPQHGDFPADISGYDVENAYISLPLSSLNFRVIDLPFSDMDRIRDVLPFELDGLILGGAAGVVFDDIIVGKSDAASQVLAVYTEKTRIREILDKVKACNIDPAVITSLELRSLTKDFAPAKLASPAPLEDEERISLAIEEMKSPTVNLRRGEFAFTRDIEKTRKSLRMTGVLLILIALVLSGSLLFRIVSVRSEIAFLRNEMRKDYQALFPGEKNIVNELYQLKSHMKELKARQEIFLGGKPLHVLLGLSRLDRNGVVFNEVTVDRENLIFKGEAPSLGDVQKVKEELDIVFSEVRIADSKSSAQGRMLFTITAKGREA